MREPSKARQETVDLDILVTSRNGDKKIMESIRITSMYDIRLSKILYRLSIFIFSSKLAKKKDFLLEPRPGSLQYIIPAITLYIHRTIGENNINLIISSLWE